MSLYEIVFSPTGGTAKVVGVLSAGLGEDPVRIDVTEGAGEVELGADDVVVIAVPSFGGHVPSTATERIAAVARAALKAACAQRRQPELFI